QTPSPSFSYPVRVFLSHARALVATLPRFDPGIAAAEIPSFVPADRFRISVRRSFARSDPYRSSIDFSDPDPRSAARPVSADSWAAPARFPQEFVLLLPRAGQPIGDLFD